MPCHGKAGAGLRRDRRRVVVVGHDLDVHAPAPSVGVLDVELRVGIQHLIVVDDVQPEVVRGCALRLVGRAVAALGARLLGRGGDNLFEFGIEPDAGHAPALGLDARPLVQRGAVHGRVMRQLGGLHNAAPRLLLGDVAGVDRRALCGVSPTFGRGEHVEALALRPGRLVFLDQPGADHVVDAAPGGVGVAVKMLVGQVCVGHGAIEPHVGHRIARAFGPAGGAAVGAPRGRARGRRVPADGRRGSGWTAGPHHPNPAGRPCCGRWGCDLARRVGV